MHRDFSDSTWDAHRDSPRDTSKLLHMFWRRLSRELCFAHAAERLNVCGTTALLLLRPFEAVRSDQELRVKIGPRRRLYLSISNHPLPHPTPSTHRSFRHVQHLKTEQARMMPDLRTGLADRTTVPALMDKPRSQSRSTRGKGRVRGRVSGGGWMVSTSSASSGTLSRLENKYHHKLTSR